MKKALYIIALSFLGAIQAKAQYVTIPDNNLRDFLQEKYPACFNTAGMMDTTCSAIVNEISLVVNPFSTVLNLEGLRYFKNLKYLDCSLNSSVNNFPALPARLETFVCTNIHLNSLPSLPATLKYLNCSEWTALTQLPVLPPNLQTLICTDCIALTGLPALPASLQYLTCNYCDQFTILPALPGSLKRLDCSNDYALTSLPPLPSSLDTLKCASSVSLSGLPALPASLKFLDCNNAPISSLPELPAALEYLDCSTVQVGVISTMPALPAGLKFLSCSGNQIPAMPALPAGLTTLYCANNRLTTLPALPGTLLQFRCSGNKIHDLPALPRKMVSLLCGTNPLHVLPVLPDSLTDLNCEADSLSALPPLPGTLEGLVCSYNQLTSLPYLPSGLAELECDNNLLSMLPDLPNKMSLLHCHENNIYCLPRLPDSSFIRFELQFDPYKVTCLPNHPPYLYLTLYDSTGANFSGAIPLCNPTNNIQHCESFPVMAGIIFYDINSNGIRDAGEPAKKYNNVSLSNNSYSFTNRDGYYEIGADSIGAYTLSASVPTFFNAVPASRTCQFINYDTLVVSNFALQPAAVVDSLVVSMTNGRRARPGFPLAYYLSYENVGTTTLSPVITLHYDASRLIYDSSSNAAVINNNGTLSLSVNTLPLGEAGNFEVYFRVRPAVAIGDSISALLTVNAGNHEYSENYILKVSGAYDPNDKQATPELSPSQVADGKYIDYIIHFQNTGTDTAFNIVLSDTLNSNLQANTLQMLNSSHNCKVTVKGNVVFFELLNILLPDSNVNEPKSHGFVSFRIKPKGNVAVNTIISNKAAIYFDYNAPVITNTATTEIKIPLVPVPLKLQFFTAVKQTENTAIVTWNTSNEINTAKFYIEQSFDGRSFITIAIENAKGKQYNSYTKQINIPVADVLYFRLKMMDADVRFTYGPVVALRKNKMAEPFTILNNPVRNILNISVQDAGLKNTFIKIISLQGTILKSMLLRDEVEAIDISQLPAGSYILQTAKGNRQFLVIK